MGVRDTTGILQPLKIQQMRQLQKLVLFLPAYLLYTSALLGQETAITGVNKGHSLYIQNTYQKETNEFCINEIIINDRALDANLKLSAIKLNFKSVDLFAPVSVKVMHKESCKPRFINPESILYHSSFKFDSLFLNDSILTWTTKGDRREGKFIIEQLKADFWESVEKIRSKGIFEGTQYVFFPLHHDGGNKYRIKYELPNGRFLYSKEMEFVYYPEPVTFSPRVVQDRITLSRNAEYEIMNSIGDVILRGQAKEIPLRLLKPGDYVILIEGLSDSFVKK